MKVLVFGKNKQEAEKLLTEGGFEVAGKDPDFVVSYGGDGTLMKAEHAYPSIPKILLKDSLICKMCCPLPNAEIIKAIKEGHYQNEEMTKLEIEANGKKLYAMNDITAHNQDPRHAVRYSVSINGEDFGHTIIGDGVVIATPFGSTAYYRSITDSFFQVGIGLAFNNSTEQSDHMVLKEDSVIKIKITRGPAIVYADNQAEAIIVNEGEEITIKKSTQKAFIATPNLC